MTYQDPPVNPRLFGWGDPALNVIQNRVIESNLIGSLPNVVVARDATAAVMLPSIEKVIRAKFHFDEGWSFFVAEETVYRLSSGQTLMVPQNIGNCVGSSHSKLLAARIAHEILALGDAEDPLGSTITGPTSLIPFIPYTYGVGRWAGNMLGGGDGSYCGAQIKGTMEHGFLPCRTPGLEQYAGTFPQCAADVGRLFGRSKSVLEQWRPQAIKFDLLEAPRASTGDEAKTLVVDKQIPLQICSGWGFAYDRFDSKYNVHLYRRSGSWSHSMQVMAIFAIKGQWFVAIRNQWGMDAHRGSPEIGIPGGCFVITFELFSSWIRASETIGIGQIQGLPQNPGM